MEKTDNVRDNYQQQAIKIRDYGSQQMQRLRDQYKLQQQHLLKLLELLDIGNCMSVIEAECMRTDSMLFDPNITFDLDQPVHVPREFFPPSSDSEYMTAGSQSDVRESSGETDASSDRVQVSGRVPTQHKRSSSDTSQTSSASEHSMLTAAQRGWDGLRMSKVRPRKPRKKRKKCGRSDEQQQQHSAQFHNTHGDDQDVEEMGEEDEESDDAVPPSSLPLTVDSVHQYRGDVGRETTPGQDSQTSGDYESARQSREQSVESTENPISPDSDRTLTPTLQPDSQEDYYVVMFDNEPQDGGGQHGGETNV